MPHLLCIALSISSAIAQDQQENTISLDSKYPDRNNSNPTKNYFKINLLGIALKNYSFQYEHAFSKRISLAIGYRSMSKGALPMKSQLLSAVGSNDPNTEDQINKLMVGNTALTPELRFYVGKKGYGRGFYFAPFYRIQHFTAENIEVSFTNSTNTQSTLAISGKLDANTIGLLLGAQWKLGKHVSLDWQIIGPQYGSSKGTLSGTPSPVLNVTEQNALRDELNNNLDIPFVDKKVEVTSNNAKVILSGPWAGVRTGLSLGISF